MKKKDIVEKKIIESLATSAIKPNPHIVDEAKNELKAYKTQKKRIVFRYAFVACAVILVCFAIVLPLSRFMLTESKYSSMQDYFDENNKKVTSFEDMVYEYDLPNSGVIEKGEDEIIYFKEKCVVVKKGKEPLYLQESYKYVTGESITLYTILNNDEAVANKYFSDYLNWDDVYYAFNLKEFPFYYSFNEEKKEGKAYIEYNGCVIYLSIKCESEKDFFMHLQNFIIAQKYEKK